MAIYAGRSLYAADVDRELARIHSTGVGTITVAGGGINEAPCTFDTVDNNGTPDITIAGLNNSQLVFNTAGEYDYGFSLRFTLAASVTQNDAYAYVRLNNNLELAGMTVKPVLSIASTITYQADGGDTRLFGAGDYIEVRLRNSTNVTASQGSSAESCYFYAKRTMG